MVGIGIEYWFQEALSTLSVSVMVGGGVLKKVFEGAKLRAWDSGPSTHEDKR